MEIICMNYRILFFFFFFSGKNKKKNVINLLSAELAQRVVGDNHKIYLGVNGLQIEHNAHD